MIVEIDLVILVVLVGWMEQIVDEMDVILFCSVFNFIIVEVYDVSYGLYYVVIGDMFV